MKKLHYSLKLFLFLATFFFIAENGLKAQCTNTSFGPDDPLPTIIGQTKNNLVLDHQFWLLTSSTAGHSYLISGESVNGTFPCYITVQQYFGGPLIAHGISPVSFTAPFDGHFQVSYNSNVLCYQNGVLYNTVVERINMPLPINNAKFEGMKLPNKDILSWTTLNEQNNAYFDLQYSTDGVSYSSIAKVNSKGIDGNSNHELVYSVENKKIQIGHNYYRLEQVDKDGKLNRISKIIDLKRTGEENTFHIYPNPTTSTLNIDMNLSNENITSIKMMDITGRTIKEISLKTFMGNNHLELDITDIPAGLYLLQIFNNNQLIFTDKINKND